MRQRLQRQPWNPGSFAATHDRVVVLQTLAQRVMNLFASWGCQLLVMRPMSAALNDLAAELNTTFPEARTASGVSPTAAVIAVTDWAFEFPFPLPPKVHVSGMLPQSHFDAPAECASRPHR